MSERGEPPSAVAGQAVRVSIAGQKDWATGVILMISGNYKSLMVVLDDKLSGLNVLSIHPTMGRQVLVLSWEDSGYRDIAAKQYIDVEVQA